MTLPRSFDHTERSTLPPASRTSPALVRATSRSTRRSTRLARRARARARLRARRGNVQLGGDMERPTPSARRQRPARRRDVWRAVRRDLGPRRHHRGDPRRLRPGGPGPRGIAAARRRRSGHRPCRSARPRSNRRGARDARRRGRRHRETGPARRPLCRRDRDLRLRTARQRTDPDRRRRNVVVRGADLNALVGHESRSARHAAAAADCANHAPTSTASTAAASSDRSCIAEDSVPGEVRDQEHRARWRRRVPRRRGPGGRAADLAEGGQAAGAPDGRGDARGSESARCDADLGPAVREVAAAGGARASVRRRAGQDSADRAGGVARRGEGHQDDRAPHRAAAGAASRGPARLEAPVGPATRPRAGVSRAGRPAVDQDHIRQLAQACVRPGPVGGWRG
jgi:hypothetical protein